MEAVENFLAMKDPQVEMFFGLLRMMGSLYLPEVQQGTATWAICVALTWVLWVVSELFGLGFWDCNAWLPWQ